MKYTILTSCLIIILVNRVSSRHSRVFLKNQPPPPIIFERKIDLTISDFFTQRLDHFNLSNTQTWSQKYLTNSEYFNNDGNNVVFLILGGENQIFESWMTHGSWANYAKKFGALLFQLEHRFYGESQPFPDLATKNLQYLSSQQALADAARFIQAMNEQYLFGSNVKWIAFGGSYAGSLSAWLRLKYPDLVYGAISSSAPLQALVDFSGYYQVVVDNLRNNTTKCIDDLKEGMAEIDDLLVNSNSSDETVTRIFNLCDPIDQYDHDHVNVMNFYSTIGDAFDDVVQYTGIGNRSIDMLCNILTDENRGSEIHRIADVVKLYYGNSCVSYDYDVDVAALKQTTVRDRQWFYQTCNEFGWYQTTNREDKIFGRGIPVDFFTKMCSDVFGPEFNSSHIYNQVAKTNIEYLGIDINATNIIYVYGSLDPWHAIGLLKANNADSPVIFIKGASHCNDMYDALQEDLPELNEAKEEISRLIGVWLDYNNNH